MKNTNKNVDNELYDGEVHQNIDHIVEETKESILSEPEDKTEQGYVSDEDIKKAIEFINPDASSMESRG